MEKQKVYLDTSVISAYFDKKTKARQIDTQKFWKEVLPVYEAYVSTITVQELDETKDDKLRMKFKALIQGFKILDIDNRTKALAEKYIDGKIFSKKYLDDALHVAAASRNKMLCLVSWNFQHLVKIKTRKMVNMVNRDCGLGEIEIVPLLEL